MESEIIPNSGSESDNLTNKILLTALKKKYNETTTPQLHWQLLSQDSDSDPESLKLSGYNSDSTYCSAFENHEKELDNHKPSESGPSRRPDPINYTDPCPDCNIVQKNNILMEIEGHMPKQDENKYIKNEELHLIFNTDSAQAHRPTTVFEDDDVFFTSPILTENREDWDNLIESILRNDDGDSLPTTDAVENYPNSMNTLSSLAPIKDGDPNPQAVLLIENNNQTIPMADQEHMAISKANAINNSVDLFATETVVMMDTINEKKNIDVNLNDEITEIGESLSQTLNIISASNTSESSPDFPPNQNNDTSKRNTTKNKRKKPKRNDTLHPKENFKFRTLSNANKREQNNCGNNAQECDTDTASSKSGKKRQDGKKLKTSQDINRPITRMQTGSLPSMSSSSSIISTPRRRQPHLMIRDRMADIQEEVRAWLTNRAPTLNKARAHSLLAEVQEAQNKIHSSSIFEDGGNIKNQEIDQLSQVSEKLLYQLQVAVTEFEEDEEGVLKLRNEECETCCSSSEQSDINSNDNNNETFNYYSDSSEEIVMEETLCKSSKANRQNICPQEKSRKTEHSSSNFKNSGSQEIKLPYFMISSPKNNSSDSQNYSFEPNEVSPLKMSAPQNSPILGDMKHKKINAYPRNVFSSHRTAAKKILSESLKSRKTNKFDSTKVGISGCISTAQNMETNPIIPSKSNESDFIVQTTQNLQTVFSKRDPRLKSSSYAKQLFKTGNFPTTYESDTATQLTYFPNDPNLLPDCSKQNENTSNIINKQFTLHPKSANLKSFKNISLAVNTLNNQEPTHNQVDFNVLSVDQANLDRSIQTDSVKNVAEEVSSDRNEITKQTERNENDTSAVTHLTSKTNFENLKKKPQIDKNTINSTPAAVEKLTTTNQSKLKAKNENREALHCRPINSVSATEETDNVLSQTKMQFTENTETFHQIKSNPIIVNKPTGTKPKTKTMFKGKKPSTTPKIAEKPTTSTDNDTRLNTAVILIDSKQALQNTSELSMTCINKKQHNSKSQPFKTVQQFSNTGEVSADNTCSSQSFNFGLSQSQLTQEKEQGLFVFGIKTIWPHAASEFIPNRQLPEGFWENKNTPVPREWLDGW